MIKHLLTISSLVILFNSCAQAPEKQIETKKKPAVVLPTVKEAYVLSDFLTDNKQLDQDVQAIFKSLDDTAIVAQLLMPAIGRLGQTEETITKLIRARKIGGLLMLNGTKEGFTSWISNFNAMNDSIGNVPFLYAADAEPSLVNRKIIGSTPVKKANELKTVAEVIACADTISMNLKAIGINYNFAPVVDMSPNKTVGFRSFGAVPANIIPWSNAFIMETQKNGIIATAKHFPGHGLVSGDTHKSLQMIDGELKEIKNYPKLIEDGVLSIMIGHLAVANNAKYDTKGLPATLSSVIVTDLLRKEMGFKGLIVTDAMNMGGVTAVPQCDMKAVEAGNDLVLMPVNADKAFADILKKYRSNAAFKAQVDESAQRIIRMKLCVGAVVSK
ncbi:MAG: glycoside hydrolase family 3 N-terminal domain-containing protein [Crocinitomicaceae bacterium]|nr:glycoside hydrolase family 3 N-terminal domain-containing protein [Crocinitomicaceae bacterium]